MGRSAGRRKSGGYATPSPVSTGRGAAEGWYLEAHLRGGRGVNRIRIDKLPFRIGRGRAVDLELASRSVSSEHAEIDWDERTAELRLRDLGSTNGTFVNNERCAQSLLTDGDIVHFADVEFRVGREGRPAIPDVPTYEKTKRLGAGQELPHNFVQGASKIVELLRDEAHIQVFQPIVSLPDRKIVAHEALTRGRHPDLPESPTELFRLAAELGLESELSRVFRQKAVAAIRDHRGVRTLFLNTHPEETVLELVRCSIELRRAAPDLGLVLEVHEKTLMDTDHVRWLKNALAEHRIQLAFDDFGAGQARLMELAEVPPDYLKFDIEFIRGIDHAPESKRCVLGSIVTAARDLHVRTIAEGVETEAEAQTCIALGFTHAQGFLFGHGVPREVLLPNS